MIRCPSMLLSTLFILALSQAPAATASENESSDTLCNGNEPIQITFDNGAGWDFCINNTERESLVLSQVRYRDVNNTVFPVLASAGISQLQVVYDDSLVTYNDVTQYGLGGESLIDLTQADCPEGQLLKHRTRIASCLTRQRLEPSHHSEQSRTLQEALNLFSVTQIGAYTYVLDWTFFDNGRIQPAIGATGALQRSSPNTDTPFGRVLSEDADALWLSHTHNYYWRLDFDLGELATDDVVVESAYKTTSTGQRSLHTELFTTEQARKINPETQVDWTLYEFEPTANTTPRGYRITPQRYGHHFTRGEAEPYSNFDFFVTRADDCERFASQNERYNPSCADDVLQFANNESLLNQDSVIWHRIAFHHVPRNEDQRHMHAHWDAFTLAPVNLNVRSAHSDSEKSGGFFGAISVSYLALLSLIAALLRWLRFRASAQAPARTPKQ